MGEVRVQVGNPAAGQAEIHQVAGLQEMLEGGRLARAAEAFQRHGQGPGICSRTTCGQQEIMLEDCGQPPADDGFGKVIHTGPDGVDARVRERFPGPAHGKDVHRNAVRLDQPDLVGDEGFGDARKPFEDHAEHGSVSRRRHPPCS